MPIFQYTGYKPDGSYTTGTVEADGLQNAILSVKARGVFPKDVSESLPEEKRWFGKKYDASLLPYISRQLSTLLSSGVPLLEALRSLSEENSGIWRGLLVDIREKVAGGASLSRALEAHNMIFPEYYVHMVAAGEQSGSLDRVLVRVADFLEKQASIKGKIRAAMIYPAFMISVGLIVMSFLFTFVVPKIVRIFENTKSALPLITVVLIGISNFFVHYWWVIAIIVAAALASAKRLKARYRDTIDGIKLKMPGGIMQSLYFARFSRTLGFLLDGGLPMLQSLELSAKSMGNIVLEKKVRQASEKVAEGARISQSLEGFPPVLLQLISTGERSGTLAEILGRAATSYEEDFERRVQKSLSLLEPGMILLMGLVVGFIVLAVLLPMFQLNQLIR